MNTRCRFCLAFVMFVFSFQLNAQVKGILVGVNAFGYKSNLFNKGDANANKDYMKYIRSYAASYGIELGYQFNQQLQLYVEPSLSKEEQKYTGKIIFQSTGEQIKRRDITSSLNYIKVPITLSKAWGEGKLKLTTQIGAIYWHLHSYQDKYTRTNIVTNKIEYGRYFDGTNYSWEYPNMPLKKTGVVSEDIYKKTTFGLHGGAGLVYNFSTKLQVYGSVRTEYSISGIENTDSLTIVSTDASSADIMGKKVAPYSGSDVKYFGQEDTTPNPLAIRSATHIFNLGLQIGFRFLIRQ